MSKVRLVALTCGAAVLCAAAGFDPAIFSKPVDKITIEILDAKGQVIRTFNGSADEDRARTAGRGGRGGGEAATERKTEVAVVAASRPLQSRERRESTITSGTSATPTRKASRG